MRWISDKEWGELELQVTELKSRVGRLEYQNTKTVATNDPFDRAFRQMPYSEVVNAILKHLGLEVEYIRARESGVKLKEREDD